MITGIDRPTSGAVVIGGTPVHELNENRARDLARPDDRRRLPVLPAAAHAHGHRERHAADGLLQRPPRRRAPERGDAPARAGRDGRPGPQAALGALRRPAAARRDRPRARQRPADHRGRRADRQPRLQDRRRRSSRCSRSSSSAARPSSWSRTTTISPARVRRALHVADGEIVEDRRRWLDEELAEEARRGRGPSALSR